jgi:hypothetical protein
MAGNDSAPSSGCRLRDLERALEQFKACVEALPEGLFLEPMNGWSVRDVVAHFIGWNRHTVKGCRDILRGVRPFYLDDDCYDFRNVNAASVQKYASNCRQELLGELDASFNELKGYLLSLTPSQWCEDTAVKHEWATITVENTVVGLREDYDKHRNAIQTWMAEL